MLKLIIIIVTCIPIYLFEEINSNNCINGANFTTRCGYNINSNNIGNRNIDCKLNFISSNTTVKFINNWIKAKKEEDNECPIINLNIITAVNGLTKDNKLSTTCGGEIEKSSFVIKLDTKCLNDQDSKVNMNLMIDGECKENGESWITWIRRNFIWITFIILIILTILVFSNRKLRTRVIAKYNKQKDYDKESKTIHSTMKTRKSKTISEEGI